jgi:hypothetical protein
MPSATGCDGGIVVVVAVANVFRRNLSATDFSGRGSIRKGVVIA